jgi:ABC-type uncharacterized transport system ATPase subunit
MVACRVGVRETVVLFAAVIIGGAGNRLGAVLGAILVPVGFEEVTRHIPTSNNLPPNLIPSLEWVAIGALIERASGLLERFGLSAHANDYAGDLSGGQRRLMEIMGALMAAPRMLLLDEPMAGVHQHLARRIGNELVALCAEGMTMLMVEHELAIMNEFCDPVVVMAEGAVLAEDDGALRSRQAERRRTEDARHGPGADARPGTLPA